MSIHMHIIHPMHTHTKGDAVKVFDATTLTSTYPPKAALILRSLLPPFLLPVSQPTTLPLHAPIESIVDAGKITFRSGAGEGKGGEGGVPIQTIVLNW